MAFELKPLSRGAVPAALEKAQRYRLLNEPFQAESICLDVLAVEPDNQTALVTLLLSLSDQIEGRMAAYNQALELVSRLQGDYARAYYEGILCERRGRAHHRQASAFSGSTAATAFQVVTGDAVNTRQSVERGRFIVELRVAPSRPLVFLTIRLVQIGERIAVSGA